MKEKRVKRIESELTKEISVLINNDIKDPRIAPITSITEIKLTNDLQIAKVYVSVLGDDQEKQDTIDGLVSSVGFIKKELGRRIKLRHIPEINFILDTQIEYAMHIEKLIDEAMKQEGANNDSESEEDNL